MAKTGKFKHSSQASSGKYGENVYMDGMMAPVEYKTNAVDSWYKEIYNYNFKTGTSKNGGVIGHFTAMIWDDA